MGAAACLVPVLGPRTLYRRSRDHPNTGTTLAGSRFTNPRNMGSPFFQCISTSCQEVVSLVNGRDARDRPGLVVEDLIRHMRRDAKPSHARHARPSQIV